MTTAHVLNLPAHILKLIDKEQDQKEKLELARAELKVQEDVLENIQCRLVRAAYEHFDYDPSSVYYVLKDPDAKSSPNGEIVAVTGFWRIPDKANPLFVKFTAINTKDGGFRIAREATEFFSTAKVYIRPFCPECEQNSLVLQKDGSIFCLSCDENIVIDDPKIKAEITKLPVYPGRDDWS